jgi:hypothetical protein
VFRRDPRLGLVDTSPDAERVMYRIYARMLHWYRAGGEVSERQWSDVLGIIRTQGDRLDRDYLAQWARQLDVGDLLERASATM